MAEALRRIDDPRLAPELQDDGARGRLVAAGGSSARERAELAREREDLMLARFLLQRERDAIAELRATLADETAGLQATLARLAASERQRAQLQREAAALAAALWRSHRAAAASAAERGAANARTLRRLGRFVSRASRHLLAAAARWR